MLAKLWKKLPWDGDGWKAPDDPLLRALRGYSSRQFRRRVPAIIRPFVFAVGRLAWPFAARRLAGEFARDLNLGGAARHQLFRDCLFGGATPLDAYIWRGLFDDVHPLGRATGLLLTTLGEPSAHQLLVDKVKTARLLASKSIRVPALLGIFNRTTPPREYDALATVPHSFFVKPRGGFAGRGAYRVDVVGTGRWRMEGGAVLDWQGFRSRLMAEASAEDVLVQEALSGASALTGLCDARRPPVLRLTIAREPEGPPFLHSAILAIPVPRRSPHNFLEGTMHVPMDYRDGTLGRGILFLDPRQRWSSLPWNGATVAGRQVPGFAEAKVAALLATETIPGLPLINWDIVPTQAGPVVLEGNSRGSWILTNLPASDGLTAAALIPLLARWAKLTKP